MKKLIFVQKLIFAISPKLSTLGVKDNIFRSLWKNWFCPKNLFFDLSSKLLTFRGKITIFWKHLEKLIFAQKIVFAFLLNYQYFWITDNILWSPWKIDFYPKNRFYPKSLLLFLLNYQHFIENYDILRSPFFKLSTFILRSPWKNWFCPFFKLPTFRGKWRYFEITLKKCPRFRFLALSPKLPTVRRKDNILRSPWKIDFCPKTYLCPFS